MKIIGGSLIKDDLLQIIAEGYAHNKVDIGKFKYDNELSTKTVQVYHSPKQIILNVRGSYNLYDAFLDYKLLKDSKFEADRTKEAMKILRKIKKKYPGIPVTAVGHSLGSFIAGKLAPYVYEVINLNSYITPGEVFDTIPDNEYLIRSSGDPASILYKTQRRKNVITIPAESNSPFTEHSLLILKRLKEGLEIGRR